MGTGAWRETRAVSQRLGVTRTEAEEGRDTVPKVRECNLRWKSVAPRNNVGQQ